MIIRVTIANQVFTVELGDLSSRPVIARIGEDVYEVWPEGSSPSLATAESPTSISTSSKSTSRPLTVVAPHPGKLRELLVKEGDNVVFGQELCILENHGQRTGVRAGHTGNISRVLVVEGNELKSGAVIMEYST